MLRDYLLPELQARDVGDIWFDQDGATPHTAHETMDILRNYFVHVISPLLIIFFGATALIEALKANKVRVIGQIPVIMLEQVIENWRLRMDIYGIVAANI
ncbi:hypothetical protein JTB14_013745 [Gonioctena quinquepunctata]|nr:hypothetical protein JTB14_013745 [Gonioctena quinquepunctata]